jgi:spore germination protein GerM
MSDAESVTHDASVGSMLDSATADALAAMDATDATDAMDSSVAVDGRVFVDATFASEASLRADASVADAGTQTVPVYYAHDDGAFGPFLYREFRRVSGGASAVEAAVEAMLHTPALDPDYESLWPVATSLLGVTVAGAAATIDLSDDALSPALGSAAEEIALQQLVYTVTAADNSITSVTLHIEGESVESLWGHVDASGPMTRAPRLDVVLVL